MTGPLIVVVLIVLSYGLGWIVGRRHLDEHDPGWMRPERRRWRP